MTVGGSKSTKTRSKTSFHKFGKQEHGWARWKYFPLVWSENDVEVWLNDSKLRFEIMVSAIKLQNIK